MEFCGKLKSFVCIVNLVKYLADLPCFLLLLQVQTKSENHQTDYVKVAIIADPQVSFSAFMVMSYMRNYILP